MKDKKIILCTLSPKTHRTSEENLGIEYLKAVLVKNGYKVDIIDAWLNEYSVDQVYEMIKKDKDNILFVGISSYMSNTAPTMELIDRLKKLDSNIKIACGGFGPTFYPSEYLDNGADFIMRGEGEDVIVELANALDQNSNNFETLKNLGYKENGEVKINGMRCLREDLDSIPFPSRDTMNVVLDKKSTVNMVTARGCSGNCEFCSVISFFRLSDGRVWRSRSIENIVDEIEILSKQGIEYVKMVDDSFVDGYRDEKWCKEFADEIERRGIKVKLRGQIRADKITDNILKDLKRAGFFSFACGIENGSQTALTRMNKKATLEDNKRALELFHKNGYLVQMGFILFDKETTMEELKENYDFLSKYNYTVTKGIFSEMFSAEGTKLNQKLKDNNELIEGDYIGNNNKYNLDNELVKKVYDALKKWHKSHSIIYDMTIDPLTAPKAIGDEALHEFYLESLKLKKEDLKFFRDILEVVYRLNDTELINYVENYINDTNSYYEDIDKDVKKLYRKVGLNYSAEANPFI